MKSEEVIQGLFNVIDAHEEDRLWAKVQKLYCETAIQHIKEQDEKIRLVTRLMRDQSDVIQLHKIRISELEEQLSDWEDKYEDYQADYASDMAQARREH